MFVFDDAVADCRAMAPGASMLAALEEIDPASVSASARVTMLELYERCDAAVAARKQRVLAAVDYGEPADDDDWIREEVAAALRLSPPSSSYRPPAVLAGYVQGRDRRCAFPGCRRNAVRCDLDHTIPWPEGPTAAENLHPTCRWHHRLKHRTRWRLVNNPDGSWTWISPTGRRYTCYPPNLRDDP